MTSVKPDSGAGIGAPPRVHARLQCSGASSRTDAWADRALHAEARRLGLDARDRALATRLAYGAVQRRATLDHLIEALAGRPVGRARAGRASPRCGSALYQLAYLDRVPAHAAVGESVELVKRDVAAAAPGSSTPCCGAARARRRRASPRCPTDTPSEAALRHSHPSGSRELWFETLGPDAARALMAADNEPAEAALRANTLRADAGRARRARCRSPRASGAGPARGARARRRRSTRSTRRCGTRAGSCRSRAPRWPSRGCSPRARASACSTCAPRPAARPPTSPR